MAKWIKPLLMILFGVVLTSCVVACGGDDNNDNNGGNNSDNSVIQEKPLCEVHDMQLGICLACKYSEGTDGLEYTLDESGEFYACTGIGTATDVKNLVVACEYEGKPVKKVAVDFNFGESDEAESFSVPGSVKEFETMALELFPSLKDIVVHEDTEMVYARFFGENINTTYCEGGYYFGNKNNPYLILAKINDNAIESFTFNTAVRFISAGVFKGSTNLSSISIPSGVRWVGDACFYGCSKLSDVYWPESCQNFGESTFSSCTELKNIDFLPSGIKLLPAFTFRGCKGLTEIVVPDSVEVVGAYAFDECSGVTSITLGNNLKEIKNGAFGGTKITAIALPDTVTEIAPYLFDTCTSLTTVTIPATVTVIGQYAFTGCHSLTGITIPSPLKYIDRYAFSYCDAIREITVPAGVEFVGYNAFYGSGLTKLFFEDANGWKRSTWFFQDYGEAISDEQEVLASFEAFNGEFLKDPEASALQLRNKVTDQQYSYRKFK